MTDSSPGPGWWLASDGNWYPPHLHPDALARATEVARTEVGTVDTVGTERSGGATTRTAETDAEILAAFHITADRDASDSLPLRSPIDEIRETTVGDIDWQAGALERASQR